MMQIREIELNNDGKIIALKGTFNKPKHIKAVSSKVYMWATLECDYMGG